MEKQKILLVDDKALLRDALIEYLGSEEFSTDEAVDGEKALELFKTNDYNAVILDHNLPGMDGLKVLKLMKQLKPNVPVIGLTGELSIQVRDDYLSAGAYDIHTKSAIYEKLIPTLKNALSGEKMEVSKEQPNLENLAETLKKEGRWEESAMYLKEAGIEQRTKGNIEKANEYFEESIGRYIRAGRRSKAQEVETLIQE